MKTIKKVKFVGMSKLNQDDADMVDYGLVANQGGSAKSEFVGMDGEYGMYEVFNLEGFESELERIEEAFEVKVVTK